MKTKKWKRPPVTRFYVRTYFGDHPTKADFDKPMVEVGVSKAEGLAIDLGRRGKNGCDPPSIQIERRPHGWMIVLQPVGGGDASGFVYFLDNGKSFVVPGCNVTCDESIVMKPDDLDSSAELFAALDEGSAAASRLGCQ